MLAPLPQTPSLAAGDARAQTLPPAPSAGQIVTASAENFAQSLEGGQRVQRLSGNVVIVQEGTTITAERATRFLDTGNDLVSGRVRIVKGTDTLEAPEVQYNERTRVGYATGGVRLADAESVVRASAIRYFSAEERAEIEVPLRLVERGEGAVLTAPRATYYSGVGRADTDAGLRLKTDSALITAQRGSYFTQERRATFEGNVRMVDSTSVLTATRGTYDRLSETATFEENVRLEDSTGVLTATRGTYDRRAQRAAFAGDVRLVDSTSVLTAPEGVYLRGEGQASFWGGVRLVRRDRAARTVETIDADTLTYIRPTERSAAYGRVRLVRDETGADGRPASRAVLLADEARSDGRAGTSDARQRPDRPAPLFVRVAYDSTGAIADTSALRARALETRRDSVNGAPRQTLTAWGDAAFWSPAAAVDADSARVVRTGDDPAEVQDDARFFGDPVGFVRRAQVMSDTLRFTTRGGEADSLFALGSAFVAERDSLSDRLHQAKGQALTGRFGPGNQRTLTLGPNAEALRWRSSRMEDGRTLHDGAVVLTADRLVVISEGDRLRSLDGTDGVEGTYYAENLVPAGLALEGLRWQPQRRPTWEDLTSGFALPPLGPGSAIPPRASDTPARRAVAPDAGRR